MWVDVGDEQSALLTLASRGIGAAPGTPFMVNGDGGHHLRLTVGLVAGGVDDLADVVARAPGARARARGL